MSIQANPGVYAVLVGSGVSSPAEIPTGWQVVEDLIGRIATAHGVDLDVEGVDPIAWWRANGATSVRYDTLLEELTGRALRAPSLLRGLATHDRRADTRRHT
jgi:hypothetical protein